MREATRELLKKVATTLAALCRKEPQERQTLLDLWSEVQEHLQGADRPEDN